MRDSAHSSLISEACTLPSIQRTVRPSSRHCASGFFGRDAWRHPEAVRRHLRSIHSSQAHLLPKRRTDSHPADSATCLPPARRLSRMRQPGVAAAAMLPWPNGLRCARREYDTSHPYLGSMRIAGRRGRHSHPSNRRRRAASSAHGNTCPSFATGAAVRRDMPFPCTPSGSTAAAASSRLRSRSPAASLPPLLPVLPRSAVESSSWSALPGRLPALQSRMCQLRAGD